MKKSINFIILGAILSIIAISAYIFTQNKIEIPKKMIISAVKSHFPIEESMFIIGDMKLSNPTVYFENDKLIIDADYEFKDRATSELTTGKAKFESELEYILKFINRFRNVCAHEDKLFNLKYNIPRITLPYMTIISPFTSRLYDLLVLLKLFLTKQDFQSLVKQVEEEWSNLSKYLAQNVLNEVMIKSGFPKNWKQRLWQ